MAKVTSIDTTLQIVRGDSTTMAATVVEDDENGKPQKFPINPALHEVWFTVKDDPAAADSQAWIRKRLSSVGDMAVRAAPKDNVVDVFLTPGETGLLTPGVRYFYDVQVRVNMTGQLRTAVQGYVDVLPDVTHAG